MTTASQGAHTRTFAAVEVELRGAAGVIRLNRPERLNAINRRLAADLGAAIRVLADDDSVAAVVICGAGRAFCAGADIAEVSQLSAAAEILDFLLEVQGVCDLLDELPKPTIAAIDGPALGGGCEVALSCDLRVMGAGATLGLPEVKIGVLPGAGGTQRLTRLLPVAVATQMLLLGEPLSAEEARHHGLVNSVVPAGDAFDTALGWADRLAHLPALALRSAKELIKASIDGDLRTGLNAERHAVTVLFGTEDRTEGMRAFLEKRPPRFHGR